VSAAVATRTPNPWLIAVVVAIATFMEVLDTTIANVALPYIAGGLGVSEDEASWVVTTYLVANAIKTAKVLGFADLGMEAIYEFDVVDMPVTVAVDAGGTSAHITGPAAQSVHPSFISRRQSTRTTSHPSCHRRRRYPSQPNPFPPHQSQSLRPYRQYSRSAPPDRG